MHIMANCRKKQSCVLNEKNGKQVHEKIGLQPKYLFKCLN